MLKFRNLFAVHTVADQGTVSAAARVLNLSQPAVTHAIRQIEEELSVALFERRRSGMSATDCGKIVVHRTGRAMEHLRQAAKSLDRFKTADSRTKSSFPIHRLITNRQLDSLIALSESRNVGRAAVQLGVSETAVYRSLRELETATGAGLFYRHQAMNPTPAGKMLVTQGKLAQAELRLMRDDIKSFSGDYSGQVVIGTLPSSRTLLVPHAIGEVAKAHPNLRFSMLDGSYDAMISALRSGDIDVVVGALREAHDGVTQELLFEDTAAILARPEHPLSSKPNVMLEDLAEASWVVPKEGAPLRIYFESLFRESGLALPRSIVETDSLIAMRSLLINDDRLTIISPLRAEFEIETGVLERVQVDTRPFNLKFGLMTRNDAHLSPGIEAFINQVRVSGRQIDRASRSGVWPNTDRLPPPPRYISEVESKFRCPDRR